MPLALDDRPRREPSTRKLPPVGETDLDRLIKLVPVEMVLLYTAAAPTISELQRRYFAVILFAVGIVAAPVILFLDGRSTGQAARWSQYLVRTLTFAACAMAIAWPFELWCAGDTLHWARSLAVLVIPFIGMITLGKRGAQER
jgi:hypothetical protein